MNYEYNFVVYGLFYVILYDNRVIAIFSISIVFIIMITIIILLRLIIIINTLIFYLSLSLTIIILNYKFVI